MRLRRNLRKTFTDIGGREDVTMPALGIGALSLVLFAIAALFRRNHEPGAGRWRSIVAAIAFTMAVTLFVLASFVLLKDSFSGSFNNFPFRSPHTGSRPG